MLDVWLFAVTLLAALGCGLMGGLFFAFSVFIMDALNRLPPAQGIAAMQSINIAVINPLFMGVFLGTALLCAILAIAALLTLQDPGAMAVLAGCALYLIGGLAVTILFNVPLNNVLAAADPVSAEGAGLWSHYVSRWTAWNHVRTLACLAAAAAFIISLR